MPATTTTDLQLPSRNLSSSSGVDHIHLTSPSRHSTHSPDHTCPSSMLPSSLKPQATKLWPLALGTCWPVGLSHLRVWVGFVYRSSCLTSPHLWRSDHLGRLGGLRRLRLSTLDSDYSATATSFRHDTRAIVLRSRFGLLPLVIPSEQKNRTRTRPCPRNPSWSMRTKKNACQVDQSKTKGEREAEPIPSQVVLALSWRSRGLWFPTVIPTPPGSPRSNPSRLYPRITCLAHGACQRCTSTSFFTGTTGVNAEVVPGRSRAKRGVHRHHRPA